MFFTCFRFCVFAQGCSLKMQLVDEKTMFLIGFIMFFEPKTLKTFILDTFPSENTIKLMFFDFGFLEGGDRSK